MTDFISIFSQQCKNSHPKKNPKTCYVTRRRGKGFFGEGGGGGGGINRRICQAGGVADSVRPSEVHWQNRSYRARVFSPLKVTVYKRYTYNIHTNILKNIIQNQYMLPASFSIISQH